MQNRTILAAAVAATVGGLAQTADATTYAATLTQVALYSNSGTSGSPFNITSSTATWSYDDVTNLVSQTGGTFNARFTTAPVTTLYRILTLGLVIGNGAAATATSFACAEGNFGPGVGASICGNYSFGANFANNSTSSWGPGTATSRTIGGDDVALGTQESVARLDGLSTVTWTGTTLILRNATCTSSCTTAAAGFNGGQRWTFAIAPVPVPAAVWLFGSGLLSMAWIRRKVPA